MCRQVELNEKHRDYHRPLWRFSPNEDVQTYGMTRVTYGVASSSYHTICSLSESAKVDDTPSETSKAILRDFYVDDILTGAPSEQEAKQLDSSLINTLKMGQVEGSGRVANRKSRSLPPEYREANEDLEFLQDKHTIKTLGIVWNPKFDVFHFKVKQIDETIPAKALTKRQVLSEIEKIFDPLGWPPPISIKLKSLMQKNWVAKLDWDDNLPDNLAENYLEWRSKLIDLREIKLSRLVLKEKQTDLVAMHVFCDASETGYGACIYVVAADEKGGQRATLLSAKAKVAPLKTKPIPRLELCAALLGCKLLKAISESLSKLSLRIERFHAWTDSTIVLSWLAAEANCWSTFVAN